MQPLLTALLGALVATVVAISAGLVFIIRTSKDAGRREGKLDDAVAKLVKIEASLELVTKHEVKLGIIEPLVAKMVSDFKELMRERRGSRPDHYNGEE